MPADSPTADFLRPALLNPADYDAALAPGTLDGTIAGGAFVLWPANDDPALVVLDGQFTADNLRAILAHMEAHTARPVDTAPAAPPASLPRF